MSTTVDRVGAFFAEKTPRRVLALALFLSLVLLFRGLLVLMVFFVAFESLLNWSSDVISARLKWPKKRSLFVVLGLLAIVFGLFTWWSYGKVGRLVRDARVEWPQKLEELRTHPRVVEVEEHLPDSDKIVESLSHYGTDAVKVLSTVGHIVIYALIGLILAVVFLLEKPAITAWRTTLKPKSFIGTLTRWFNYVSEAVSVTVQLQLIVAACNTVFTLPILFLLGIPEKPLLMMLIFVSGLVPVIGNIVSGAVLSAMAWVTSGPIGVVVFLVLTFVLHKVEAYYLNPRLVARHVKLPGFVLIVSLICWEHLLGFTGLFVSFPFLFIAGKIRAELAEEDAAAASGSTS